VRTSSSFRACIGSVIVFLTLMGAFVVPLTPPAAAAQVRLVAAATVRTVDQHNPAASDTTCAPCKTIQGAINQSSPGDSILVAPGVYTETLLITESLVITGGVPSAFAPSGPTVVDADGVGSVATISNTVAPLNPANLVVGLTSLTLQDGDAAQGAGVLSAVATVGLSDTTVQSNTAGSGGGIAAIGSLVAITNSTVESNSADNNAGGIGAIAGVVQVTGSTIVSNTAGADAGGIGMETGGSLRVSNSFVLSNTAGSGDGGGIGVFTNTAALVTNSTVASNTAGMSGGNSSGGEVFGNGGGIETYSGSPLTVISSTVVSNTAGGYGGDIDAVTSTVTVSGSSLISNTAAGFGGGIEADGASPLTVTNSSLVSNTASNGSGGGLDAGNGSPLAVSASTVVSNSAGFGGGIAVETSSPATVTNSTVASNTIASDGGGGGIDAYDSSPLTVVGGSIVGNAAAAAGGGSGGGGIEAETNSTATVSGASITGNIADFGGGIEAYSGSPLTVTNSSIAGNTASNGRGGGIEAYDNSPVVATGSSMVNNTAGSDGGAIGAVTSTVTLSTTSLLSNLATGRGGGLSARASTVALDSSTVATNTADSGGGLANITGTLALTNSTLSGNTATSGGGILNTGALTLTLATLAGNSATGQGGGLDTSGGITATARDSIVAGNGTPAGPDCNGPLASGGYNVLGASCATGGAGTGDRVTADPRVGPLQNNGGSTLTRALLPGSPAIGLVPAANCAVATDQRGVARPFNGACDAGAYQSAFTAMPTSTPTGTPVASATGTPAASATATGTAVPTGSATAVPSGTATTAPSSTSTSTNTAVPSPTSTNTAIPSTSTSTNTAIPPTSTNTAVPTPTSANTAVPSGTATTAPSSTSTSANTAVPPTSTSTPRTSPKPQAAPALTRRFCVAGGIESANEHAALAILNANGQQARVAITLYFADGAVRTASFLVGANAQRSVAIASLTSGRGAFGLCVASDRAVSGQLNLTRPGKDGDSELGSPNLGTTWYLAEGYTGLTFHEDVAILNPNGSTATVRLRLLLPHGDGDRTVMVMVGAHSERVVDVNSLLGKKGTAVSIVAASNRPVVVERTLTFGAGGYGLTTRDAAPNAATSWLFAEGSTARPFQTFLTVLNPQSRSASVTATFFGRDGRRLGRKTLTVATGARATLLVNNIVSNVSSVASVVTSDRPVVVERPEYFGSPNARGVAGSDVFGRTSAAARWLAPGGALASGDSEFLLLYNPGARAAQVDIAFYSTTIGQTATTRVTVPAGARYTFDVNAYQRGTRRHPGPTLAASHGETLQVRNGGRIVVERSVFGRNHGTLQAAQGLAL